MQAINQTLCAVGSGCCTVLRRLLVLGRRSMLAGWALGRTRTLRDRYGHSRLNLRIDIDFEAVFSRFLKRHVESEHRSGFNL